MLHNSRPVIVPCHQALLLQKDSRINQMWIKTSHVGEVLPTSSGYPA